MIFDDIKTKAIADREAQTGSGKPRIIIGDSSCNRKAGSVAVLEAVKSELEKNNIEATVSKTGCIGMCYAEPIIEIVKPGQPGVCYGNVTPETAVQLIKDYVAGDNPHPDLALGTTGEGSIEGIQKLSDQPMLKSQMRVVLGNCGTVDPENINDYIASGGYGSLAKVLGMKPEDVIAEVKKSGLRGRGGAGFPAGMKWDFCRKEESEEKYFICNADEGDPGSFVDRTLLESDPHAVVEGLIIGSYAMGATKGYIYIRSEYPLAAERFETALKQARELNLLGDNILGSGFNFDIEIRIGAGVFICGEETALIDSIEGKQGFPRTRPPFPTSVGLFGKPTSVNNVETLANVPKIIDKGGDWYAGIGTDKSKGTKLFSLSGNIERTGVIEVPMGTPLRQMVEEIGGGVPNDRKLKVIQPAGGMLGLIPADLIDTPADFESLASIKSGMSSGGFVIIDDSNCIVDLAYSLINFAYDEMCGQCSMGRIGTTQLRGLLRSIIAGNARPETMELMTDLIELMPGSTLCPLCGGAICPTRSILDHFKDELDAHLKEHRCPANVCPVSK